MATSAAQSRTQMSLVYKALVGRVVNQTLINTLLKRKSRSPFQDLLMGCAVAILTIDGQYAALAILYMKPIS